MSYGIRACRVAGAATCNCPRFEGRRPDRPQRESRPGLRRTRSSSGCTSMTARWTHTNVSYGVEEEQVRLCCVDSAHLRQLSVAVYAVYLHRRCVRQPVRKVIQVNTANSCSLNALLDLEGIGPLGEVEVVCFELLYIPLDAKRIIGCQHFLWSWFLIRKLIFLYSDTNLECGRRAFQDPRSRLTRGHVVGVHVFVKS